MKLFWERKLDYYIGPLLCTCLLAARKVLRFSVKKPQAGRRAEFKNALIVKFFGMGSILLASPSLRALKARHPSCRITVFTFRSNRDFCRMLPWIDEIVCLSVDGIGSFFQSLIRFTSLCSRRKFDVIINLEFLTHFSAFVTLVAALYNPEAITSGFRSPKGWRNRVHDRNFQFDHTKHIIYSFARVIGVLEDPEAPITFDAERGALSDAMDKDFPNKLRDMNSGAWGKKIRICVNINAGDLCPNRKWPPEYFAECINKLVRRGDTAVFLIGSRSDMPYVSQFKKMLDSSSDNIVDLSGKADMRQLVSLLAASKILITNDSGPLHLASVLGLPTISFFGPETPRLYGPVCHAGKVYYRALPCSPCINIYNSKMSTCKNNICLKNIHPDEVIAAVEEICRQDGRLDDPDLKRNLYTGA